MRPGVNIDLGMSGKEFAGEADEAGIRGRYVKMAEKFCGKQLVDEDAAMLRVILKLDDVAVTIAGLDEMSLSAAAHLAQKTAGFYRHLRTRKRGAAGERIDPIAIEEESLTCRKKPNTRKQLRRKPRRIAMRWRWS